MKSRSNEDVTTRWGEVLRKYSVADIERLKACANARAGHGPAAAGALRWGQPVLTTAITSIGADGPKYRGQLAVELAMRGLSFEAVAELLWTGTLQKQACWEFQDVRTTLQTLDWGAIENRKPTLSMLLAAVPVFANLDQDTLDTSKNAEWARARRLIRLLISLLAITRGAEVAYHAIGASSVAESLAIALGTNPEVARAAIDKCLVLCADHELNASAFAARVVASTDADLYACITGGLAALTGTRHGAYADGIEALLEEVREPERAPTVLAARITHGQWVPGFGQAAYPKGDPRCAPLLDAAHVLPDADRRLATIRAVNAAMEDNYREWPVVDMGLVAISYALGLPRGSASILFAIGRIAGLVAHILEQREAGFMIRPRAEYIGK